MSKKSETRQLYMIATATKLRLAADLLTKLRWHKGEIAILRKMADELIREGIEIGAKK